jgi:hypothetical protein
MNEKCVYYRHLYSMSQLLATTYTSKIHKIQLLFQVECDPFQNQSYHLDTCQVKMYLIQNIIK